MKRRTEMYEYADLVRIAKTYYQDKNCCTVVALTHATMLGFGKVFHTMRRYGRITGKGGWLFNNKELQAELGISTEVVEGHDYWGYEKLGISTEVVEGHEYWSYQKLGTVSQVVRRLPKQGAYWLLVRAHIIHVENGEIMDWVQANSRRQVTGILKITREFQA